MLRASILRSFITAALGCSMHQVVGAHFALAQDSTEYHSCNGILTNKPCDGVKADLESALKPPSEKSITPSIITAEKPIENGTAENKGVPPTFSTAASAPEVSLHPPASTNTAAPAPSRPSLQKADAKATAISKSKKDSALHNLRMKLIKGKRSVGVDLDISSAVDACTSVTTSLEECRTVVNALDTTLEERITTGRLTKIAEDKAKVEATTAAKSNQNQTTVVIVQPNVRPTATPFFVFDTGPLLPVDPSYRRPSHRPPHRDSPHRGDNPGVRPPPASIPPAPAGGAMIDAVPRKNQR